jgi:pimeloyl-ACP methyl ester carboxylesterase
LRADAKCGFTDVSLIATIEECVLSEEGVWKGTIAGRRVESRGSGTTLVLIHGVALDLTMWARISERLAADFRVVLYDTIGHGPGPHPASPYDIVQYADQLNEILETLAIESCIPVGFSMGGLIAEQFALSYPQKTKALVVLNSVFQRSEAERAEVIKRVIAAETATEFVGLAAGIERWFTPSFREAHPEVVAQVAKQMAQNDLRAFAAAYRVFATADETIAPRIGEIKCPALIATGSDDQRSTAVMAVRLAERLPNGRAEILPAQRHLTPIEIPDELASMIGDFVARLER